MTHSKYLWAAGLVLLAACADSSRSSLVAPGEPAALIAPRLNEGDPTYYSTDVEATYSGGYDGYDRSDAVRSERYNEELIWDSGEYFWNVDLDFPADKSPLGSSYPDEVDVARTRLARNSSEMRDRGGALLVQPESELPLEYEGRDPNSAVNYSLQPIAGTMALAATGTAMPVANEDARSAGVDRRVITPKGSQRTLGRLQKAFKEGPGEGGQRVFTQRRGSVEVKVYFTPTSGAVTRTLVLENDRLASQTDHKYRRYDGVWVLAEETTTLTAPAGKSQKIVRKFGNPTAH